METPTVSRLEAVKNLIEAAGGKLVSLYSTAVDGPGVMVIFDVPEGNSAPAISGVAAASGTVHNIRLIRLMTQDEVVAVRQKAAHINHSFKPVHS